MIPNKKQNYKTIQNSIPFATQCSEKYDDFQLKIKKKHNNMIIDVGIPYFVPKIILHGRKIDKLHF